MGKYMRKAEATSDVAVMDVSQSSFGVRTRAKTLALRRLQSTGAAPSLETPDSYYYLELRSRRLEKPLQQLQTSRRVRRSCRCEVVGLEIDASLGGNLLNTEVRESRDTRESTPCSSTMGSNPGPVHGSNAASRRGALNSLFINVPTPFEVEEFFTHEEQALQRFLTEKYNFDFVNELPLPGRYEWVKVSP
ncbi:cyclin-dependent kinase inhibitor 3-like isoform X1 [Primulina eburnea]|uniref:cyclin-dependent kinase inhibitor 3-like isoform X1 n=1 Tax=Primulina eburnea TaxID=1245227 RepID=UPI003C6C8D3B